MKTLLFYYTVYIISSFFGENETFYNKIEVKNYKKASELIEVFNRPILTETDIILLSISYGSCDIPYELSLNKQKEIISYFTEFQGCSNE